MRDPALAPARRSVDQPWLRVLIPVIIGLVIGAALGYGYALTQTKRYTATTQVSVYAAGIQNSNNPSGGRTNSSVNMDTEAQIAVSSPVTTLAGHKYSQLRNYTHADFVKDISISVPPNSTVLQLAFTTNSPVVARKGADALAAAYLQNRRATAIAALRVAESQPQSQATKLSVELNDLAERIAVLGSGPNRLRPQLQSQQQTVRSQLNAVDQQLAALTSVSTAPGIVLTHANLPKSPSSPVYRIYAASGAAIGLIIGLLIAWMRMRFRRAIRRADDVTHVVDLPCLTTLPPFNKADALVEPYRRLALLATATVGKTRALVITTPLGSASSSEVALGIAAALARSGTSTALIRINTPGGQSAVPRNVEVVDFPSSDGIVQEPNETLAAALIRLQGKHDFIVIDVPWAATNADAATVAAAADAVIMVVDTGSRSHPLRDGVRALDEVGSPMLGVVLSHPLSRFSNRGGRAARGASAAASPARTYPAPREQTKPAGDQSEQAARR